MLSTILDFPTCLIDILLLFTLNILLLHWSCAWIGPLTKSKWIYSHRDVILSQWFGVVRIVPVKLSLKLCALTPSGIRTLNICKNIVENRKSMFLANVFPAHWRLPAPNGSVESRLTQNFPDSSKKRSGRNSCGLSHTDVSCIVACNDGIMTVPFGML